jgi:hypothetical protein
VGRGRGLGVLALAVRLLLSLPPPAAAVPVLHPLLSIPAHAHAVSPTRPLTKRSAAQGGEDKLHGRAAQPPGEDFLAQLREFTEGWRLRLGPKGDVLHAAYADVKTHLGSH